MLLGIGVRLCYIVLMEGGKLDFSLLDSSHLLNLDTYVVLFAKIVKNIKKNCHVGVHSDGTLFSSMGSFSGCSLVEQVKMAILF